MHIQDLLGFLLPPLVDLINARIADSRVRYWVSMIICFAVGILVNLQSIHDPKELFANAALVFTSAQITYHSFWEKSDTRDAMMKKLS